MGASLAFPDVLAIEIRDHTGRVLLALGRRADACLSEA